MTEDTVSLLTVVDAAAKLNVAKSWIYAQVEGEDTDLPYVRIGRYIRFEPAAIEEFIRTHRRGSQPDPNVRQRLKQVAS